MYAYIFWPVLILKVLNNLVNVCVNEISKLNLYVHIMICVKWKYKTWPTIHAHTQREPHLSIVLAYGLKLKAAETHQILYNYIVSHCGIYRQVATLVNEQYSS